MHPPHRVALTLVLPFALSWVCALGSEAQAPPTSLTRWSATDLECPEGAELARDTAPDGSRSALWCQLTQGAQVAPHGPYLELFADGTTARQGWYRRGIQVGPWIRWTPEGQVEASRVLWPGEASRHIPRPQDLCPPGAIRERSRGHDHRRRLWSRCLVKNESGEEVEAGPHVTWDEAKAPDGSPIYVLREILTYQDDQRHGPHRSFEGPFGGETLVEDETFQEGLLEGDSRAFYLDGMLREQRFYRRGQFHGDRVGYDSKGRERWRVTYKDGRRLQAEGDLTVDGQPCPEHTVPVTSADGREDFCARRTGDFEQRHGAFLRRDEAGLVVERGLYEHGKKVELWQAPPGVALPPRVADEVLVAEIELLLGEQTYQVLHSPPTPPPPPPYVPPPHPDLEALDAVDPPTEAPPVTFADQITVKESIPFDIWFKNNDTRQHIAPRTLVRDGVVQVYGLPPGHYYMKVEIDANRANGEQWPGDLISSVDFAVVAGEITRTTTQLLYTLHLIEPWDNEQPIPGWRYPCRDEAAVLRRSAGSIRFAWHPPPLDDPTGVEYVYRLTRKSCDPHRELEVLAEGSTYDSFFAQDLPPSRRGEVYEWTLLAKRGDRFLGQLMLFGDAGYGWSLRFRVR